MTNTTSDSKSLVWPHGVLSVEPLGAMLGPTLFVLPDGRQIAPFHIAPWSNEPGSEQLPGILRHLRGEWPCVPFGSDADRPPQGQWPASSAAPTVDPEPHGHGSNHAWAWGACTEARLSLAIDYPPDHPISRLERHISPDPHGAAIDFELSITARRDCTLPIGLHPVFRLPDVTGGMVIEADASQRAMTYPGDVDPSSVFAPDQIAQPWTSLRLRDGSVIDPSRVPLTQHSEDLLQLLDMPGHVTLWNSVEGYRVHVTWQREHFPSLLLWYSNHGRQGAPWLGRHRALGVEPVCSAFDLGGQISAADNPIAAQGTATARSFRAGETFVTRYRIAVEAAAVR